MRRVCLLVFVLCLLLCGCSAMWDGHYVSITPNQPQNNQSGSNQVNAADYDSLYNALVNMVESGNASGVIHVQEYDITYLERDIKRAVSNVTRSNPIAAYAVDSISWELGNNSGQRAVAVSISYVHDRMEILKIRRVADLDAAVEVLQDVLDDAASGVVLHIENYEKTDFDLLIQRYVFMNPHKVMEAPVATANVYPESTGDSRVVELKLTYQNSRDALRAMKTSVSPIFSAAGLYVSGSDEPLQKFSQLYSFLMERYPYQLETSITPAYSLLCHGVGDSRAFAMVYAVMCRNAGLECQVVNGTRNGESWYWNLVNIDGVYYHVDLLRSNEKDAFSVMTDDAMEGYVWDYSAYPAAVE